MYVVEFTLRSPTCVAQRPTAPGQPTESLRYLTGTVVRGALASLFLRGRRPLSHELSDEERKQFQRIFLSGEVVFGNAWPKHPAEVIWKTTQVVPRTAWSHKRDGGWRGGDNPGGGVCDALTALLYDGAEELTNQGFDRYEQEFACARGGEWEKIEVRRRLISRTALTRNEPSLPAAPRGVAAAGQLYSFEAIETGQQFYAPLHGDTGLIDTLFKLFPRRAIASIGQGRSRGIGQVELRILPSSDPPARDPSLLAKEARDFTNRARASVEQIVYLPVTLLSDTILRDNYLVPCSSGDPQVTLSRYANSPPPKELTLHYAVQSTRWLGGWDAIRDIPRPPQLAVQQGSVWVYAIPPELLDSAIQWWLTVEASGVGERRNEGFGQLCLLHTFHATEAIR